jgi:hypothetical protein
MSGVFTAAEDDATTASWVDDGPGVADLVARIMTMDKMEGREQSPAMLM